MLFFAWSNCSLTNNTSIKIINRAAIRVQTNGHRTKPTIRRHHQMIAQTQQMQLYHCSHQRRLARIPPHILQLQLLHPQHASRKLSLHHRIKLLRISRQKHQIPAIPHELPQPREHLLDALLRDDVAGAARVRFGGRIGEGREGSDVHADGCGLGEQSAERRRDAFEVGGGLEHAGEAGGVPGLRGGFGRGAEDFGDGFGERREGEKGGREGSGCGERSGAFVESVEVAAGGDARDGSGFGDVDGGDEARPKLLRIVENDVFAL